MRFVAMFFGVFSVVYVGRHMAVFEKRGYRHAEFFILFYFFLRCPIAAFGKHVHTHTQSCTLQKHSYSVVCSRAFQAQL